MCVDANIAGQYKPKNTHAAMFRQFLIVLMLSVKKPSRYVSRSIFRQGRSGQRIPETP